MDNLEEMKLLKKLIEAEDAMEAPVRQEFYTPHYEFVVSIGKDHTASIILDESAYFELMESEEL